MFLKDNQFATTATRALYCFYCEVLNSDLLAFYSHDFQIIFGKFRLTKIKSPGVPFLKSKSDS